jgi:hypothetical protein
MIWKLYKKSAGLAFNMLKASLKRNGTQEGETCMQAIEGMSRIIDCLKEYENMHPSYAKSNYGSIGDFMKQRLTRDDLSLWIQLQDDPSTRLQDSRTGLEVAYKQ